MLKNIRSSLRELNRERKERRYIRNEPQRWAARGYAAPSPAAIKRAVILRNGIPNGIWVETGTYKGDTAALLAQNSSKVYTIEPAQQLFEDAKKRFASTPNVEVIQGISEEIFPQLIPRLSGQVNFWLDGHYSTGVTFQGPTDCPLVEELACIEANLRNFSRVAVLIDDIRYCINPASHQFSGYPKLDVLVDWARKNGLEWHIEHDMFIARTPSPMNMHT